MSSTRTHTDIPDGLAFHRTSEIEGVEDSGLVAKGKSGFFVKDHPEFLNASKYILKAACTLLQSGRACLVVLSEESKMRTIRTSGDKLSDIEKFLAQKCFRSKENFYVDKLQPVYDEKGKLIGRADRSLLLSPLMVDNSMNLGVLVLSDRLSVGKFSPEDLAVSTAFSKTFARLMYSCLIDASKSRLMVQFSTNLITIFENLYLYKKNVENNFLLSEMIKVSKMINSTLDLKSLLESIMESAKMVLKAEASSLMLIDKKTNELFFNVISGEKEKDLKEIRIPLGVGIAGIVAESCKPLIVNDAQSDERVFKEADAKINFITRNMIATPLMVRNRVIGVIEVINSIGRDEFTEKDLELFNTFSEQAALAIHNRELIDSLKDINKELKKKVHELSSLHEVSKALMSTLNEKDLFDSVVRIIADELQAERVSIMLLSEETGNLEIISQYGLGISSIEKIQVNIEGTLSGLAYRQNRLVHTNSMEQSQYSAFQNSERYHTGFCIVHPLSHGDEVYGVINISEKHIPGGFSDDDIRLVSTIAGQITKGIQNFRLLQEMLQKRSYEKELEITSSIQKSILPSLKIDSMHFDLGVLSAPAKTMGGDFYDYIDFQNDEFVFSIADVSGKSLPAALFMAVTSSIIRTVGREKARPADVLYKANDLIYQDSQSGMFVTLFYAMYISRNRELLFSSGGHNEQLIYRHDTHEFETLAARGRPLGVVDSKTHGQYGEGKVFLRAGDILILYTDGVVEAINEKREEFGMERFCKIIQDNVLLSADQMVKRIYREIKDFEGTEPQFDDFTLMIVKIL